MADQFLTVKVISPNQVIFQGQALSVSSKNEFGNFDILPYHANFITLVQNQAVTIRVKDNTPVKDKILSIKNVERLFRSNIRHLKFQFPIAIIYAANNEVKVYTDIVPQLDKGK